MTDKHIVKVRMLGACVIITVPAAVREVTGIESGNYVYVETNGKRGFTITKGALPVKKKPTAKAAKPLSKTPAGKKVAKLVPKKKAAPKVATPAPKLTAPPLKKKLINKPAPSPAPARADVSPGA